jgi:hypothetical protein
MIQNANFIFENLLFQESLIWETLDENNIILINKEQIQENLHFKIYPGGSKILFYQDHPILFLGPLEIEHIGTKINITQNYKKLNQSHS